MRLQPDWVHSAPPTNSFVRRPQTVSSESSDGISLQDLDAFPSVVDSNPWEYSAAIYYVTRPRTREEILEGLLSLLMPDYVHNLKLVDAFDDIDEDVSLATFPPSIANKLTFSRPRPSVDQDSLDSPVLVSRPSVDSYHYSSPPTRRPRCHCASTRASAQWWWPWYSTTSTAWCQPGPTLDAPASHPWTLTHATPLSPPSQCPHHRNATAHAHTIHTCAGPRLRLRPLMRPVSASAPASTVSAPPPTSSSTSMPTSLHPHALHHTNASVIGGPLSATAEISRKSRASVMISGRENGREKEVQTKPELTSLVAHVGVANLAELARICVSSGTLGAGVGTRRRGCLDRSGPWPDVTSPDGSPSSGLRLAIASNSGLLAEARAEEGSKYKRHVGECVGEEDKKGEWKQAKGYGRTQIPRRRSCEGQSSGRSDVVTMDEDESFERVSRNPYETGEADEPWYGESLHLKDRVERANAPQALYWCLYYGIPGSRLRPKKRRPKGEGRGEGERERETPESIRFKKWPSRRAVHLVLNVDVAQSMSLQGRRRGRQLGVAARTPPTCTYISREESRVVESHDSIRRMASSARVASFKVGTFSSGKHDDCCRVGKCEAGRGGYLSCGTRTSNPHAHAPGALRLRRVAVRRDERASAALKS
ncbi:hypothetical protein OF83DRAFT_1294853 [Amylostereum chailletii]|nr:hypothetical protein OF83DRAFT_1294853 [Amylostereum chailletii]